MYMKKFQRKNISSFLESVTGIDGAIPSWTDSGFGTLVLFFGFSILVTVGGVCEQTYEKAVW